MQFLGIQSYHLMSAKICIFLRYTHITPIFWVRTDPTQWDHNFPTSWGNSGYLRFSGRRSFVRSAGRFMAPIAQSGLSWGSKMLSFGPSGRLEACLATESTQTSCVFHVPQSWYQKYRMMSQKNWFSAKKNCLFGPQNNHLGHLRPYNSPPNSWLLIVP